uniref:Uncharacterized protein n=1 Tax=Panagrolaimus sp. ES5 TaxID=591445 RepID=A0AC34G2Y8_9BILA
MQQLTFQRTINFAKEKRYHSSLLNHSSLNGSSPTKFPDTDSLSLLLNKEVKAKCLSDIYDMVNINEDVENIVEKLIRTLFHLPCNDLRFPPLDLPGLYERSFSDLTDIYIRWTEAFCQPFEQHSINASIKDISISLLAAELAVTEKLKAFEACEIIFVRYSGVLQKELETNVKLTKKEKKEI